ncbi:precorrin-2 dehydrogenase/sirohydrochlorin ferrochelatase family protein [Metabacillus sp. 84]|uniref:precorrin-2 dehydrogenase/sirohydrochlorin ferrochelatase family protein n=1 Tax=unclassified Metabacillus TaxID=2675274 RepID=UPI003CF7256B
MIPFMIDLTDKPVLIAGGGAVAVRRLKLFLRENARITVISPEADGEIQELHAKGLLEWKQRPFALDDLTGYLLVVAATDDREVNKSIAVNANPLQLVNIADEAMEGNTQVPSHASKGRLTLAVHTGGASPARAREICIALLNEIEEGTIDELDTLYEERREKKRSKRKYEDL